MSLLGIIPARGGSRRIKDKNIVEFFGKPIIAYSLEAMREARIYDEIHVSTDSEQIREVAVDLGCDVPFLRTEFHGDMDRLFDVAQWVLKAFLDRGVSFDEVGIAMACSPLIEGGDLGQGYQHFLEHGRRPLFAVAEYPAPPQQALLLDGDGCGIRPERPDCFQMRSQDLPHAVFDTGAFYFFAADDLLTADMYQFEDSIGFPIDREKAADINTPEDLEFTRVLFAGREALRKAAE